MSEKVHRTELMPVISEAQRSHSPGEARRQPLASAAYAYRELEESVIVFASR